MRTRVSPYNRQAYVFEFDPLAPLVTEVVKFDYSRIENGYDCNIHLHHYHQLDIILDGELTLKLSDGVTACGRRGDAWFIPALVQHGIEGREAFHYASFKFHLAPRYWSLFGNTFHQCRFQDYLLQSIDALGRRCLNQKALTNCQTASVISCCLVECSDQVPQVDQTPQHLQEFRQQLWPLLEKVQMEPAALWSVEQMARELNFSRDYFSRCFHRVLHQSPQRYLLETAMRHAAGRLQEDPYLSIKQIATEGRYASVQAFTRAFVKVFGISPAAYREQSPTD